MASKLELIKFQAVENLHSWQSLRPDNWEWHWIPEMILVIWDAKLLKQWHDDMHHQCSYYLRHLLHQITVLPIIGASPIILLHIIHKLYSPNIFKSSCVLKCFDSISEWHGIKVWCDPQDVQASKFCETAHFKGGAI